MISLTRLNGHPFALNADLIERVDAAPDTVLTLVDGSTYVVAEAVGEVLQRILEFRASVVALSHQLEEQAALPVLRVISNREE